MRSGGQNDCICHQPDFRGLIDCSAFMLVGVKNQADVGQVESEHRAEVISCMGSPEKQATRPSKLHARVRVPQVEKLIAELAAAGSKALGLPQDEGTLPRLMAYARSVARFPCAIKEVTICQLWRSRCMTHGSCEVVGGKWVRRCQGR